MTGNSTAKQIILDNATIGMTFDIRDSRAKITRLVNKQTGESVAVTTGQFFSMTLADGTVIGDDQLSITTLPEVSALPVDSDSPNFAQRSPGTQVLSKFTVALPQGSFELTWVVELRTDANYVEQRFVVTPKTGPVSYTGLRLLDVSWPGARTEGKDDGSPVVAGGSAGSETFFAGLENPMSKPTAASGAVRISLPSATPIPVGSSILESTAIGVSVPGQMRRSFQYYVERERAHARHTFLHYQTWYDLKPPGNMINGAELTKAINLFGTQLTSRGAKIDSFWVDDGWDYLRDPRQADESNLNTWSFDPTQFPTGFTPQKQAAAGYGASMSVWMSPFGGYGGSEIRAAINASKPEAERYERDAAGFKLSGPRYNAAFTARVFDMIDNQGVRGFKFDGIGGGLFQTGPNPAYLSDYEALLALTKKMRAHQSDIWINATVGTWGSPYWLWYVDSIWRDGSDNGQVGSGSTTQQYMSHRDDETIKNETIQNPLFPTSNVMNHGLVFSNSAHNPHFNQDNDLTKASVRADLASDAKAYFATGLGLQELYVLHTAVDTTVPGNKFFWDTIAANARWARENEMLLNDSHFIGGSPSQNQVYGKAAWNAEAGGHGVLMLRNPGSTAQKFTINVQDQFELPAGFGSRYALTERDGAHAGIVTDLYRPYTIELQPYEVLVFEAAPTAAPVTPSPFPSIVQPLRKVGWTATANTQETKSENGNVDNAIDGSPSTLWHSQYNPSTTPFPHSITVDTGKQTTWGRFDYVPRPFTPTGTGNGVIKSYTLESSTDGTSWTEVASGNWTTWQTQTVSPPHPVTGRYFRLTSTAAQNGAPYTTAAELDLFAPARTSTAPTDPPATIADPHSGSPTELHLGLDGTVVRPGGTIDLADIPSTGWFHVALQPGSKALGWVTGDDSDSAHVQVPAETQPGTYTVVVQDETGRVASSGSIVVKAQQYSDVAPGDPFFEDIQWLTSTGVTSGFPDGTFRPAVPVERQAMAAFLYRLSEGTTPAAPCTARPYQDVPISAPFCGEIAWLKTQDISNGWSDGTFRPTAAIERQAMASFLFRWKNPGEAVPACTTRPFTDVGVKSGFCGAVGWLKSQGVTQGFPDGSFHPGASIDRQATAAFLNRLEHRN